MALSTDAWVRVDEAKNYCNVTGTSQDALFEKLVNSATDRCQKKLDRLVLTRTYTNELYDGDGTDTLYPNQWPVTTLTKVEFLTGYTATTESWTEYHPTLNTAAIDLKNRRSIYFRSTTFPRGRQNVRLTYVAGWSKTGAGGIPMLPQDLKDAALLTVAHLFKAPDRQLEGIASKTFAGETTTYRNEEIPLIAQGILEDYRRVVAVA